MELLDLKEIWCPVCRTHYATAWDSNTNSSYIDQYRFQAKYVSSSIESVNFHACFYPKYPTIREQDLFQIKIFHFSDSRWEIIVELNYLPDYITPFNFSEKLKKYLPFL